MAGLSRNNREGAQKPGISQQNIIIPVVIISYAFNRTHNHLHHVTTITSLNCGMEGWLSDMDIIRAFLVSWYLGQKFSTKVWLENVSNIHENVKFYLV